MSDQDVTRTWTEAPASWNIRYTVNGYDEQITLRGDSFAQIKESVDAARKYVSEHYTPRDANTVKAINTEPPTKAPAPSSPVPVTASTSAIVQTLAIVKFNVEPRQDGKVNLNFFGANHKYADIRSVKTPAEAAAMLQPTGAWTPEHFSKLSEYTIDMLIDWRNSDKMNSRGQPYKNIVAIRAA